MPSESSIGQAQALSLSASLARFGHCSMEAFGANLRGLLFEQRMSAEEHRLVNNCLDAIREAITPLGPDWYAEAFGSVANGFAMSGSDVDISCHCNGVAWQANQLALEDLRSRLQPLLANDPKFEVVEEIWSARIPVLRLKFDLALDVDLTCHNLNALCNTRLLRAYSDLSPVVHQVVIAVKVWAKSAGVHGARAGHLSSYSVTLMAIYFLQVECQVPCIPTNAFDSMGVIACDDVPKAWACSLTLPELVRGFFAFYVDVFRWGNEVVSVRSGERLPPAHRTYAGLAFAEFPSLHIEDPYETHKNLSRVLATEQEYLLWARLSEAHAAFCSGQFPTALRWRRRRQCKLVCTTCKARIPMCWKCLERCETCPQCDVDFFDFESNSESDSTICHCEFSSSAKQNVRDDE